MSIGLPVAATCRMIGHAWTPRTLEPTAERQLDVCSRCDAVNEPKRASAGVYEPRHLRSRP